MRRCYCSRRCPDSSSARLYSEGLKPRTTKRPDTSTGTTCINDPFGTPSTPTGLTYLDVLKLSGSDVTIQLSFKYIAARLNLAACEATPATPALCPPGSLPSLLGEVEDYFDPGVSTDASHDDEAGGDFNPNPDDTNTDDKFAVPVGSNPPCKGNPGVKAACVEGKRLLGLLNSYFSTVGEQFCPLPSSIPEA